MWAHALPQVQSMLLHLDLYNSARRTEWYEYYNCVLFALEAKNLGIDTTPQSERRRLPLGRARSKDGIEEKSNIKGTNRTLIIYS